MNGPGQGVAREAASEARDCSSLTLVVLFQCLRLCVLVLVSVGDKSKEWRGGERLSSGFESLV